MLTDGGRRRHGSRQRRARSRFERANARRSPVVGQYGAGDSFAGALTCYLAAGSNVVDACERAALHGAAVLVGINPIEHQTAARSARLDEPTTFSSGANDSISLLMPASPLKAMVTS